MNMKRITSVITFFLCMSMFSVTAFGAYETSVAAETYPPTTEVYATDVYAVATAEEIGNADTEPYNTGAQFETMGDLYQHWYMTAGTEVAYPDYVCGVWSVDGGMESLMVAVTKDEKGEAGKEEILSLVRNHESVSFTYMAYSYAELHSVQEKVTVGLKEMTDEGIVSSWGIGVQEMDNAVVVDIDTSSEQVQEFMNDCFEQYGNMIIFNNGSIQIMDTTVATGVDIGGERDGTAENEYSILAGDGNVGAIPVEEGIPEGEIGAVSIAAEDNRSDILIWTAAAAVLIIGISIGIIAMRTSRARQTEAGNITDNGRLNSSQVEAILKSTSEEPQRDIFGKVMKEIEK